MVKELSATDNKMTFLKKSLILYFILLVLFFSLFFVVHAIALTFISIPNVVEINKNKVILADIATINSDEPGIVENIKKVELGKSPSPGEEKALDKNYVILRLKKEAVISLMSEAWASRVTVIL